MSYDLKEETKMNPETTIIDERTDIVKGPEDYQKVPRYPIPDCCDQKKLMKAVEKLASSPYPFKRSHAALLPLTPFEQGFVMGVFAEYHAKHS